MVDVAASAHRPQSCDVIRATFFKGNEMMHFESTRLPTFRTPPPVLAEYPLAYDLPMAVVSEAMKFAQILHPLNSRFSRCFDPCRSYAPATNVSAAATSSRARFFLPSFTSRALPASSFFT